MIKTAWIQNLSGFIFEKNFVEIKLNGKLPYNIYKVMRVRAEEALLKGVRGESGSVEPRRSCSGNCLRKFIKNYFGSRKYV
jgi:hypothetical protein